MEKFCARGHPALEMDKGGEGKVEKKRGAIWEKWCVGENCGANSWPQWHTMSPGISQNRN